MDCTSRGKGNSMKALLRHKYVLLVALLVAACLQGEYPGSEEDLFHVYLTWAKDQTATSITINYHHTKKDFSTAQVYYDTQSRAGDPSQYAFHSNGKSKKQKHLKRKIEVVTLQNLSPDTTYYFVVGDETSGFSGEKKFRTLPGGSAPVKFVQGGDMGNGDETREILKMSATYDPDFAVIGGDIAYAEKPQDFKEWDTWLKLWTEEMVTSDGRLIPMVLAIGNHEVDGSILGTDSYYYEFLFEQTGKTYFERHFGDHTVFLVLDTGHVASHSGAQKTWLKKALSSNQAVKNKLAVYHIPLYPSYRDYELAASKKGRKHWLPLFDEFGLTAAFENHDHTQKRTKQLFNNKANSNKGTTYFGDGCWGKSVRDVHPERWYLDNAHSAQHFWLVETSTNGLRADAVDITGRVIDHAEIR